MQKLNITGAKGPLSATEVAFFSYTSSSAVIRNIGLTNVNLNTVYSSVDPGRSMAGLVAYNGGTIVNSYVTGKFVNTTTDGTPILVAGLVGQNKVGGRIENSYAMANKITGEATSTSGTIDVTAGGLVATNQATIKNCYSRQQNTTAAERGMGTSRSGGLIGINANLSGSGPASVLSNSYAAGTDRVSATVKHGFVVLEFGTSSNNYWDTETSGSSATKAGATGLSTAQMKAVSGTYPSALGDQFILTAGSYPKLKYGGKADGHCGGSTNVTCGAAIRGQ